MVRVMKEHSDHLQTARFLKVPTAVAVILLAGFVEPACSSSAPISQGGQGGSTASGQGTPDGAAPTCIDLVSLPPGGPAANCNTGDQQVAAGPGLDSSGSCPPERECYTLQPRCGPILCVLPEGMHCNDLLSCNPGDTPTTPADEQCQFPTLCYTNRLCSQFILCRATASPYAGICAGTWSDGGIPEPPDASAGSEDAGRKPCCGDGIVDTEYGEQCDLGPLNGAPLNTNKSSPSFWDPDPNGIVLCDSYCMNPNTLCDLDWKGE